MQCTGSDIDGYNGGATTTITVQAGATVENVFDPTINLGNNANVTVSGTVTNNGGGEGIFISGGTLANTITINNGGSVSSGSGLPALEISSVGGNSANTITVGGGFTTTGSVLFQGNTNTGTFTLLPTATLGNDGSANGLRGVNMGFVLGGTGTGSIDTGGLDFATYTKNTAAAWTLAGTNAENWTITTGVLAATNASIANATLSSGATLNFDQAGNGTHTGNITGTGGLLTKTGAGTVTLTGTNTYTGTTTITGGALNIAANNNIGTGALVLNGGALQFGGAFSSTRLTTLQAGGGTFDTNGNNNTLTGIISGTGALAKTGAGTLTLNAVNTFTGNIAINGGTLAISNNNNLGATTNDLTLDGGTLQSTAAVTMTNARTVTLGAGGGTFTSNTGAMSVAGVVSGAGDLTITGAGNVTFSGTNTYTGETNISGGTLVVSSNAHLGNVNSDINFNGGTLQSSGTTTMTNGRNITLNGVGGTFNVTSGTTSAAGVIDGLGALTKSGAGTLSLTGANTYSGGTTISGGILQVTTASMQGNVTNNANLTFNQTTTGSYTGDISGTGSLTKAGTGTVTLTGTNTHTGGTSVTGGLLTFNDDAKLGDATDAVTLAGGGLRYDAAMTQTRNIVTGTGGGTLNTNGFAVTQDGDISGTTGLTKTGTGTLTLSGNNTYAGATTITAGTVTAAASNNLGTGAIGLAGGTFLYGAAFDTTRALAMGTGGGTLNTNGFDVEVSGINTGTTLLTKAGAGELELSGASTNTGGITITGGSIRASANNNFGASGTLTFNGANTALNYGASFDMTRAVVFTTAGVLNTNGFDSTLSGVVSGAGNVTKTGAGILTLSNAANTYTGTTTINGGTVSAGANLNLGALTANIAMDGGTLRTTGTFTMTNGRDIALNAGGGTFETATGTTLTAQGIISGTGDFNKTGAGTLVLSGVNTYTGDTNLNAGTISVSNNNQLGNVASDLVFDGGTLLTTTGITSARAITLNAGGGTFNSNGTNSTLSGNITGTGDFTKTGVGIVTLSGTNSFLGDVAINGGSLQVSSDANLGDAANALTLDGGTLRLGAATTLAREITLGAGNGGVDTNGFNTTLSEIIDGAGSLTKSGTGILTLTGANTYSGGTIVSTGTLRGNTVSIQGNVTTNAALEFDQSTDDTFADNIDGTGSLTKSNTGELTLTGTNTYSGGTTISGGKLIGNTTSIQGNIINNAILTFNQGTTGTYGGTLSGTGALEKTGAGILTLGGTNTYTGGTTISAGTLSISADANLGGASSVLTLDGGTLRTTTGITSARDITMSNDSIIDTTTVNSTFSGNITGTGAVTKNGTGALALSGANSFVGDVTVNAGVLQISADGNLGDAANILTLNNAALRFGASTTLARLITLTGVNGAVDTNGFDVVLSDIISSSGKLTKAGTGILTLSGANTYTGNTEIDAGTLRGTTATIRGNVINDATLEFDQNTDGTHTNNISGTGALVKNGTGNVTLAGAYTYSGGTTISDGTLTGNADTLRANITNNSVLVFDQVTDDTFVGTISGTGDLYKEGAGTLALTGTHTYSGDTFINDGTFRLNGTLSNSIATIANGGTLAGNATLDGIVVQSGGTVGPGNSIGTINVNGNVTFMIGSNYDVEIDNAGNEDLIAATGTVTINGGVINLIAAPGIYAPVNVYTLVTGTNVTGAFDSVIANVAWLDPHLSYTATEVILTVNALSIDLGEAGGNSNAQGVSDLIEIQGPGTPLYDALVFLPEEQQAGALAQVSGESYATEAADVATSSSSLGDTLFNVMAFNHPLSGLNRVPDRGERIAAMNPANIEPAAGGREDRHIWAHLLTSRGSTDGGDIASSSKRNASGIMAGADWIIGGDAYAGVFLAVQDSVNKTDAANSRSDTRSITPGIYGGIESLNGLSFRGLAAVTRHTIDAVRKISFGGFNETLTSSRDGVTFQAQGEVSKNLFVTDQWAFSPYAAFKGSYTYMDDAIEDGGAAALTVSADNLLDVATVLGARMRYHMTLPEGQRAILETQLGWQHRFGDEGANTQVSFTGGTGAFTGKSENLPRDSAVFGLNTGLVILGGTEISIGYWGQLAKESQDHGLRMGVRADF